MRCLALAQALQSSGDDVHLAACCLPEALEARVAENGLRVSRLEAPIGSDEDASKTIDLAKQLRSEVIVADGYSFKQSFQRALKAVKRCFCFIDDGANLDGYSADILVNPNLYATEEMYADREVDKLLVGRKYAMLRREFWEQRDKPAGLRTRHVLITMGGSDPDNVTGKVIRSVKGSKLENIEIRAIAGAGNPYWETLQVQASRPGHTVELLQNVADMRAQFDWADICISAAGNTALELACVGLASLYIVLVDNQEPVARAIRKHGFGRVLGWHEDLGEETIRAAVRDLLASTEERDRMGRWGRELVDGQGALRVASALREACS